MMAVKFKIGFQIDAETLFGLISKFLPLEDLHVEEVVEHRAPTPRLPKSVQSSRPIKQRRPGSGKTVNIVDGLNGLIMKALADGEPHRFSELQRTVAAGGYAGTGIGSTLTRLRELGFIERVATGMWRKTA